jgi:uncharacterized protein YjlB
MTAAEPETLLLQPGETMPNSRLPVLIYRGAMTPGDHGAEFEHLFNENGWRGIWRNGVYDFDHYHSNAHEVLGVGQGRAEIQLGGVTGVLVAVVAGDAVLLPAGTGHRRMSRSNDFVMIGAYPKGQEHYDICRSRSPEAELRISKVALPTSDPIGGERGAATRLWK